MRRVLAVAVLAAGALLVFAPAASAHAVLESSEPPTGSRVEQAPAEVVLRFSEAPDPKASSVVVLASSGEVLTDDFAIEGTTMRVALGDRPAGVYTISWRVLSTVDGHVTGGAVWYGVRVDPGSIAPVGADLAEPTLSPVAVAGRWMIYAGVLLLGGAALGALHLFAGRAAAARSPAAVGAVLAAAGVVLLAESQRAQAGVDLDQVFATSIGRSAGLRMLPLVVVLAGVFAWRRALGPVAVAVGAAGLIGAHVVEGHAGVGSFAAFKSVAQGVHLGAAAIWIGGLVALLVGIRGLEPQARGGAVRRFSAVALWLLFVVAATGGVRALNEAGGISNITETTYGRIVIAKGAALVALLVLGALNRYRSVPRAAERPRLLYRLGGAEIGLVAVVLALTGVLASIAPGRVALLTAGGADQAVVLEATDFGTTTRARLRLEPGAPGPNRFSVTLADYDTDDPIDATRVRLTLRHSLADIEPVGVDLRADDDGWSGDGVIPAAGGWTVEILVVRGGDSVTVEAAFRARDPARSQNAIPGDPTLYDVSTTGGRVVQMYVDPQRPGRAEVHATFFQAGVEMTDLRRFTLEATRPDGTTLTLQPRVLSPGHVVGTVNLEAGLWRFDAQAASSAAGIVAAHFEHRIEP